MIFLLHLFFEIIFLATWFATIVTSDNNRVWLAKDYHTCKNIVTRIKNTLHTFDLLYTFQHSLSLPCEANSWGEWCFCFESLKSRFCYSRYALPIYFFLLYSRFFEDLYLKAKSYPCMPYHSGSGLFEMPWLGSNHCRWRSTA